MARSRRYPQLNDHDWLREQYVTLGRNGPSLARQLGCSTRTVYDALRRAGIDRRPRGQANRRYPQLHDADWLRAHLDSGMTLTEIAAQVGCKPATVGAWARRHQIPVLSSAERVDSRLRDPGWMHDRYVNRHQSLAQIAAEISCHRQTVQRWLVRHGIDRRPPGAAPTGNSTAQSQPWPATSAWA